MYCTKLEMTGFKSFAQKSSLSFDRGISSIVGPNGSGKSNIADAIRWVLGEQSLKLLRGKKSEDVIFSGSSVKARLGMAEVSLTLNNEDRHMPIDASEVRLTRRLYRNGEGEYLVNGKAARLSDIQLMLAKANFGQRSYSVIGQGMIDHILVATPSERKAFFDEAAGVRQFQIKREQALNKLALTEENLKEAELLMAEIEPHLRTLTRHVRRLEKREGLETELHDVQIQYYTKRVSAIRTDQEKRNTEAREREAACTKREGEIAAIQKELNALETEQGRHETFERMQSDYNRFLERKNALLKEQIVVEGQAELAAAKTGDLSLVWLENREAELKKELDELDADVRRLATDATSFAERRKHHTQTIDALDKKLKTHETTLTQFEHRLRDDPHAITAADAVGLARRIVNVLREREVVDTELGKLTAAEERTRERLAVLTESRERLQNEYERVQRDHERLSPKGETKTATHAATLRAEIAELDKKMQSVRESILTFNREEQKKKERLFSLQKAFRTAQAALNDARNSLNTVRVELARLDTRFEDLAREIREELPKEFAHNVLASRMNVERGTETEEQLLSSIHDRKHQLSLIGGIDENVVSDYKVTNERFTFLSEQVEDLRASIEKLEKVRDDLDKTIQKQFHESFHAINREFGKYFKALFEGGSAKLVVQEISQTVAEAEREEEDEDETNERGGKIIAGIDIIAQPPGKRITGITMLSGGEKALTSIALICAILATRPSPFVVLDEVDAALDEANSQRFAAILKELVKRSQFITITHNRATMQISSLLYGVTMSDDGVSKLLSIKMADAAAVIEQHGNR